MKNLLKTATLALAFTLMHAPVAFARAAPVAASFSTAVPVNAQSALQLQGSDADGTPLTYAIASGPSHGTLSQFSASTGAVIYTPTANYVGSDSFTYTVASGGDTTAPATVTLTVTAAKTRVIDTVSCGGAPCTGTVTFILTKVSSTPSGIMPAGATVSAVLTSSGQFDVSLYPSQAVNPVQYYQVKLKDAATGSERNLGLANIPAATTVISLAGHWVTDTNLAAQYTFASKAEVDALTQAVANATLTQLISQSRTIGKLQKWDGSNLSDSPVSEAGGAVSIGGNTSVAGTVTATGYSGIQAANVPPLDAAKIATGVLDPARLGTGTRDGTKFLRDDGTFQSVQAGVVSVNGQAGAVSLPLGGLTGVTLTSPTSGDYLRFDGTAWKNSPPLSADLFTALGYTPLRPSNNLSDVQSASAARANLGLGTLAPMNASNVNITGGTVQGVTLLDTTVVGTALNQATAAQADVSMNFDSDANSSGVFRVQRGGVDAFVVDNNRIPNFAVKRLQMGGVDFLYQVDPAGVDGQNIFIAGAGNRTMAGGGNTFDASRNIAIGPLVLVNNTTGFFNNVIGYESMRYNTTGAGNAVLGSRALVNNTTAHDNAAMGDNALFSNTTGYESQGIGYRSLYNNTTGYHNSAFGYSAGQNNLTGYNNVFLGPNADVSGAAATAGVHDSVAIGAGATITASGQIVLGSNTTTQVITVGTINANNQGANIRLFADGTGAKDGGIFSTAAGDLYFANWDLTHGLKAGADGTMNTVGAGGFGVGTTPGTDKLKVAGAGRFTGTLNADSAGANIRVKSDGTDAADGAILTGGSGDIYFSNWNLDRGLKVQAGGVTQVLGTGLMPTRLTTSQRDAIASPQEGQTIYNLTTHQMNYWNGSAWVAF